MTRVSTQGQFQRLQKLPFCYQCGAGNTDTLDHVPPKSMFCQADRTPPLKLPAHFQCNNDWSHDDEWMGQLVSPLSGRPLQEDKLEFDIQGFEDPATGERAYAVANIDLKANIRRWLPGFHAALYGEFLGLDDGRTSILEPLPAVHLDESGLGSVPPQQVHYKIAEALKQAAMAGSFDEVLAYNGKCHYRCVWSTADDKRTWLCFFALNIHDWTVLGANTLGKARTCLGLYCPEGGRPEKGTVLTDLMFDVPTGDSLDPFNV